MDPEKISNKIKNKQLERLQTFLKQWEIACNEGKGIFIGIDDNIDSNLSKNFNNNEILYNKLQETLINNNIFLILFRGGAKKSFAQWSLIREQC